MGLDTIELVMAIESAFEVTLEDSALSEVRTPRDLVDLLVARLPHGEAVGLLSERAIGVLCEKIAAVLDIPASALAPSTSLVDILPKNKVERDEALRKIQEAVGARCWPRIAKPRWLRIFANEACDQIQEVAAFLVRNCPCVLKRPGEGWSRKQIAEVVRQLIIYHFGIPATKYSEHDRFIEDMQVE